MRSIALEDHGTSHAVLGCRELNSPSLQVRRVVEATDTSPLANNFLSVASGRDGRITSGDVDLEDSTVGKDTIDSDVELGLSRVSVSELERVTWWSKYERCGRDSTMKSLRTFVEKNLKCYRRIGAYGFANSLGPPPLDGGIRCVRVDVLAVVRR